MTGQIHVVKKAGAPPPRATGRLNFAPSSGMGDSPGAVYKVVQLQSTKVCVCVLYVCVYVCIISLVVEH